MAKKDGKGRGNGPADDDDFDQGGDEAARRKRVEAETSMGHNTPFEPSGETLDEYLAVVAEQDDKIEAEKEALRLKAEPFRERIKGCKKVIATARDRLVEDGYGTKELNTFVKQYRLRRAADRATKELDDGMKERHAAMERAWRDFSGIPGGLGEAALRRETVGASH